MQSIAQGQYTEAEVLAALRSPVRKVSFRYELLDSNDNFKKQLELINGEVQHKALAQIKRTATFTMPDDPDVDWLSDRIRPWVQLEMPDGGLAEWPQGVFLLSTPGRNVDDHRSVTREVDGYDKTIVLVDDKISSRHIIETATKYEDAIAALLESAGIFNYSITPLNPVASDPWQGYLPAPREWDPGTSKLHIINDLISAINYRGIWFDSTGKAIVQPYVSPDAATSEFTYEDSADSVMFGDMIEDIDLFDVANRWVLVVSEPNRPPLVSSYTNSNPDSPTSTVNRDRTIVDFREQVEAAAQSVLDAKVERLAQEASQVYSKVEFGTGIVPWHSHADVLTLVYSTLGLAHKYSETGWVLPMHAGARMVHEVRRVVSV